MTLNEILWDRGLRQRSIGVQVFRGGIRGWEWLRPHVEWLYGKGYCAIGYHREYDTLTLYFKRRTD